MLETLKVTPFGAFHTVIAIVAVIAGLVALVRYVEISPRSLAGKIYIAATILTCLTGFGIFHHGGFGKPHVLGIITLVVLGVAIAAARSDLFGRFSRYVATVCFSMTFFFHMIPTVNETATRFPLGAPLAADAEAPDCRRRPECCFFCCWSAPFCRCAACAPPTGRRSTRTSKVP